MSQSIANVFSAQLQEMRTKLGELWMWPSPDAGFGSFVFAVENKSSPLLGLGDNSEPIRDLKYAPNLACGGYWLASPKESGSSFSDEWMAAFARFTLKDAFPADRQSFAYRPIEFLGITLGCVHCFDRSDSPWRWLTTIIHRLSTQEGYTEPWSCLIMKLAADYLHTDYPNTPSQIIDHWESSDIALAYWITRNRQESQAVPLLNSYTSKPDELLMKKVALEVLQMPSLAAIAVTYYSLERVVAEHIRSYLDQEWSINREGEDAVSLVRTICKRFHLFAKKLERRHDNRSTVLIKDEYDVQDLLHSLLCMHFDDVRPEEPTPSKGSSRSRMDFLIKQQRIVVEVKYACESLKQKKIVGQLAIDKQNYRSHPDCGVLVCFVYDPLQVCENPSALEDDLSETGDDGFVTTVIVSPRGT